MNIKYIFVPLMACGAGLLMSVAWIGHLKFKDLPFGKALLISWMMVFPEYILNVSSARWGRGTFTGGQVAAMHLAAGIVAVALVSRFYLGEPLTWTQILGFGLMLVSVMLIVVKW